MSEIEMMWLCTPPVAELAAFALLPLLALPLTFVAAWVWGDEGE